MCLMTSGLTWAGGVQNKFILTEDDALVCADLDLVSPPLMPCKLVKALIAFDDSEDVCAYHHVSVCSHRIQGKKGSILSG